MIGVVQVESDGVCAAGGVEPIVGLVVEVSDSELLGVRVGRSENVCGGKVKGALVDSSCILGEGRKNKYATALDPSIKENDEDVLVGGVGRVVEFSCVNL